MANGLRRRLGTVPATKIYPLYERPRGELQPESPEEAKESQPKKDTELKDLGITTLVPDEGQSCDISTLPGYVHWNDGQFSAKQMCDLLTIGATSLPNQQIIHELVQSYLDWVHPQLPLLDLDRFLSTLCGSGRSSPAQVSLLLLNAVLFAGSLYSVDKRLPELGFDKWKDFQDQVHKRARVCLILLNLS